jgi:hypothetical protein
MSQTPNSAATPQPARALRTANHVRRARAMLKTQIADGQTTAAEIILTCPAEVARMPIAQLLATQRGWGDARCRTFLAEISIAENKPIGSLTERQRLTIASLLSHTTARSPVR